MKNILITGASGFIGSSLCSSLSIDNKVIGVDIIKKNAKSAYIAYEQVDLADGNFSASIFEKYSPDVVIYCAGIAHQKMGSVDSATYMRVNSEATENFAKVAGKYNPDVCFIFFSSVSVYGEDNLSIPVSEQSEYHPSSDYAVSKLDAERRLITLVNEDIINRLIILRLAPVYDRNWSLNLDRRIFSPKKLVYFRFGSGTQRMSALARPNIVDFIGFLIERKIATKTDRRTGDSRGKNTGVDILNICDVEPYKLDNIIEVFKKSGIRPNRPVISVPLIAVWLATRIAGLFFPSSKSWLHSGYNKLASSLVFDNGKMMGTGFKPIHSLETIFCMKIAE